MPIVDPFKRRVAQAHLLYMRICRKCGARNDFHATKCRRCHSKDLREKKREARR
ncbi:MAG: 50S ribosomal protein L40e [Promethearchaeota archaeon]